MKNKNYRDALESFLIKTFLPAGFTITKDIILDSVPESSKYDALVFSLNNQNIIYRKGKITPDRPGAFLAVWQRPCSADIKLNKPIALTATDLDYLFVKVQQHSCVTANEEVINNPRNGIFIFPVALLIQKGIVSSEKSKGKTGFRVFPPWSKDRGL
ncbi:MAG: MepB family protein, partial [Pseudomonadales bacterium]|nr:MepB family protein [Pseudomonadales bacterium]